MKTVDSIIHTTLPLLILALAHGCMMYEFESPEPTYSNRLFLKWDIYINHVGQDIHSTHCDFHEKTLTEFTYTFFDFTDTAWTNPDTTRHCAYATFNCGDFNDTYSLIYLSVISDTSYFEAGKQYPIYDNTMKYTYKSHLYYGHFNRIAWRYEYFCDGTATGVSHWRKFESSQAPSSPCDPIFGHATFSLGKKDSDEAFCISFEATAPGSSLVDESGVADTVFVHGTLVHHLNYVEFCRSGKTWQYRDVESRTLKNVANYTEWIREPAE